MPVVLSLLRAKIQYVLQAECMVPGMLKTNIRRKLYMNVHQVAAPAPVREIRAMHSQQVTKCCCCAQGTASVTASVEKDS